MFDCEKGSVFPGSSAGTSREYHGSRKRKSPKSRIENDNDETPSRSRMSHPAISRHPTAEQNDDELDSNIKRQRLDMRKRSIVDEDQLLQAENVVIDDDDDDVFPSAQLLIQSRISDNENNESRMQFGCEIAAHCLGSNLSSEQLSSYLTTCIQLNNSNKINTKNAFSLQLIDYMCVLLERNDKTINDFPTLSCGLDASSKIYACRVDCIHSGVMEIASGLASVTKTSERNKSKNEMESSGEHSQGDEVEGDVGKRTEKRKRKNVITTLESICRTSIETGSWTHRPAIPPDFTSLLSYASINRSENSGLSLLQDDVPLIPKRNTKPPESENRWYSIPFDLSKGSNLLSSDWEEYELSGDECNNNHSSMNNISYIEADDVDNALSNHNEEVVDDLANIPEIEESVHQQEQVVDDLANIPEIEEAVHQQEQVLQNTVFSNDVDDCDSSEEDVRIELEEIVEIGKSKRNVSREDALNLVNAKAFQAAEKSVYSYFDTGLLPDLWAGPEYWKPRFGRHKTAARILGETPKKAMKRNTKNNQLSFEDLSDSDFEFDKNKEKCKLDRQTMVRWRETNLTMPLKNNYKKEELFCSFLRKTFFYKRYLEREEDMDDVNVEIEYADDTESLFEEHFQEDICAMSENKSAQDNDSDSNEPLSHGDNVPELATEEQAFFETNFNKENSLLSRPNIVQHNTLTYAKVPKKLDMKLLKHTVWRLLDFDAKEKEHSTVEKSCIANNRGELLFSNIYKQLLRHLPNDMRKDTSPALAFLTLLHLANEKTLKLKSINSTMTDVQIEKY